MNAEWKWYALGSAFFAGLTAVLAKVGVEKIPSNLATLVRTGVVIVFLSALVTWRGEWRSVATIPGRSLTFLVLSGLATGFSWICYYRALQAGPASLVSPIDKLSLVVTLVFAVLFLGERLRALEWLGGALIAVGVVLTIVK